METVTPTTDEVAWARDLAASLLAPLGQRWAHTLGVAQRARAFAHVLSSTELEVLVAAAYVHDVGYAPALARTGFHPVDGAEFLRTLGRERLACLVAHHSGARVEADERGLLEGLEEFTEELSVLGDALTYCDLTTDASGATVSVSARLREIVDRYGRRHPVGRAIERCRDELLDSSRAVEQMLTSRSRG